MTVLTLADAAALKTAIGHSVSDACQCPRVSWRSGGRQCIGCRERERLWTDLALDDTVARRLVQTKLVASQRWGG